MEEKEVVEKKKVKVKNISKKELKLIEFNGVIIKPDESVEIEADERQIKEIGNTPTLELEESTIESKPKAESKPKKKTGDE